MTHERFIVLFALFIPAVFTGCCALAAVGAF